MNGTGTDEESVLNYVETQLLHYGARDPAELAESLAYDYRTDPDIWPRLIDAATTDTLAYRISKELCFHLRHLLNHWHEEFPAYLLEDPAPEFRYLLPGPIADDHAYFALVHANLSDMIGRHGTTLTRRRTFHVLTEGLRSLRAWCIDMASGRISPPRKPGRNASDNMPRDAAIVLAVADLLEVTELPLWSDSRRSACGAVARSACEAVAERIGRVGAGFGSPATPELVRSVYWRKSAAILQQRADVLARISGQDPS